MYWNFFNLSFFFGLVFCVGILVTDLVKIGILPVIGSLYRCLQCESALGELVDRDIINHRLATHRGAEISSLGGGVSLATDGDAYIEKSIQGADIMEYEDGPEVFYTGTDANAYLSHPHEGVCTGVVVMNNADTPTEAGNNQVNIGIGEYGVAGGIIQLRPRIWFDGVELGQHFLPHGLNRLPSFFGCAFI